MTSCVVCGDRARARGRCGTCYAYFRRHGKDRGFDLVKRLTEKDIQRELERALEQRRRRSRGWDPNI